MDRTKTLGGPTRKLGGSTRKLVGPTKKLGALNCAPGPLSLEPGEFFIFTSPLPPQLYPCLIMIKNPEVHLGSPLRGGPGADFKQPPSPRPPPLRGGPGGDFKPPLSYATGLHCAMSIVPTSLKTVAHSTFLFFYFLYHFFIGASIVQCQ